MKKLIPVFTMLFVSSVVLAGDAAAPAGKTHEVKATVVSVDAAAKTITIKVDGADKTVPVMGSAVETLKTVKAGDNVTMTCQDNEKGEHQGVTGIVAAAATK
ncbi:MAG: VCBS domain-containing protein [Acidobacteriota bacterium]